MAVNRRQIRWQMKVDRGGMFALCDLCGVNPGTDMHEIITRAQTVNNDELRDLSFDKAICSLLCNDCHVGKNLAGINKLNLLAFNVALYGLEVVNHALQPFGERLEEDGTLTRFIK